MMQQMIDNDEDQEFPENRSVQRNSRFQLTDRQLYSCEGKYGQKNFYVRNERLHLVMPGFEGELIALDENTFSPKEKSARFLIEFSVDRRYLLFFEGFSVNPVQEMREIYSTALIYRQLEIDSEYQYNAMLRNMTQTVSSASDIARSQTQSDESVILSLVSEQGQPDQANDRRLR